MRIRQPISERYRLVLGAMLVAIMAAGYSYISYRQHVLQPDDTTLPQIWDFKDAVVKICTPQGTMEPTIWLWVDSKATFVRLFLGMFFGCLFSLLIGLGMGCFNRIEAFFAPTFNFLAKIPPTAMLPIFFVLVGTGETMFTSMIAFGVLPTLTMSIYLSAKYDVQTEMINLAYTKGAKNMRIMWCVVARQIMPKILDAIRLQIGPALVYLIAAEFMMAETGFGYRLRIQQRLLHMDVVYVYVVILGLVGYGLAAIMLRLRERCCPWFEKE